MFRITEGSSSGSVVQYLAKIYCPTNPQIYNSYIQLKL